jgi:ABC-2 type transport system ATP-binding protein
MNVIETHNLTKIYNAEQVALNGAYLRVPGGSTFGLVGPNGAGKTTTIKLLLGLHMATAGDAQLFGERMTPNATHLRRRVGFLPTNPQFPRDMNPIQYLDFVGKLFSIPAETRKPRLAALLRAVGLLGASAQKIKSFSTGMTTRLGIAASLMNDPELLIWDEPTAGLDPEGRKYTMQLIHELGQSRTILVSSHDLGDIERVCDHIGIMSDGKLIFNGPLGEMKKFTRPNVIQLELEGDLDGLCKKLVATYPALQFEREPAMLRLHFPLEKPLSNELAGVLTLLAESGVRLRGIHSLRDDMVDAFIRLLEEERAHGFSRILHLEPAGPQADHAADDAIPSFTAN